MTTLHRGPRKKQLMVGAILFALLMGLWRLGWSMELVQAVSDRDEARVARALKLGADPNFPAPGGPVLLVAVWVSNTNPEMVRLLVDAGADPNQGRPEGNILTLVISGDAYDLTAMMLNGRRLTPIKSKQLRLLYELARSEKMRSLLSTKLGPKPPTVAEH